MNTAAQHTPGPYEVQPLQSSHGADIAIVAPANGFVVAIIPHDPDIQTADDVDCDTVVRHPQDMANAQLLAAAPELLAALERAVAEIEAWRRGLNVRNMNKCKVGATFADMPSIRAAIAKAKGGAA
ncbi:MAG: hypothetical protein ACT6Q7_03000 [Blastomonas fulva]|uniref:hypothetical protein n=1 Tax=Blastomonas fulva TaxID=1550728 RepID=UPI004034C68B